MIVPFGPYRGRNLNALPPVYKQWLLNHLDEVPTTAIKNWLVENKTIIQNEIAKLPEHYIKVQTNLLEAFYG